MLAGVVSSCLPAGKGELLEDSEIGSSITGSRIKHGMKCVNFYLRIAHTLFTQCMLLLLVVPELLIHPWKL